MSEQVVTRAVIPQLRFPEFLGDGSWYPKKLDEIAVFLKGKGISKSHIDQNGKIPCIRYGELYTHYGEVIDSVISKTNIAESALFFSESNDVIIPSSGETHLDIATASCVTSDGIALGGDLNVIRSNENGVFLSYYLNGTKSHDISKIAQGNTVVHLYSSQLKLLDLLLPKKCQEQQKIADCLSSIDNLITAHIQKYHELNVHKKGLMQKLFPVEDEVAPKLRFTEFRDAKSWVKWKFGDITDFSSGGTPSKDIPEYWDGEIPWISASSMHDTCLDKSDHNITQFAVDKGARTVPKGTLLLLVRGSMLHKRIPVGITALEVAFNQDVKALSLKKDVLERFMLCLIIASERRLLGAVTKTGIGAGKLDTNDLKDFLVRIPTNIKEQQKIADCLSSIDDLITAQAQKIKSLKAHKKGLMQQLFPVTDEVNA